MLGLRLRMHLILRISQLTPILQQSSMTFLENIQFCFGRDLLLPPRVSSTYNCLDTKLVNPGICIVSYLDVRTPRLLYIPGLC